MTSLFFAILVSFLSLPVFATSITGADYNSEAELLSLNLVYFGGLKNHNYTLEYDTCQFFDGVKEVSARLIDSGHDDTGHNEFSQVAQFSLKDLDCKPSWLTVRSGAHSFITIWIE